jgi:transcription initiation factor IIE alpha subunit
MILPDKIPFNSELLKEVLFQIEKDLSLAGFPVKVISTEFNNYQELVELVKNRLVNQLNNKLTEIKRILYHLDLGNNYFEIFLSKPQDENFLYLAELIIKKALLKVVNRKIFSA